MPAGRHGLVNYFKFCSNVFSLPGSVRSYFRGNGANVVKIAPETALKLTLNDTLKQVFARDPENIRPSERFVCGGVAGALAQVSGICRCLAEHNPKLCHDVWHMLCASHVILHSVAGLVLTFTLVCTHFWPHKSADSSSLLLWKTRLDVVWPLSQQSRRARRLETQGYT